MALLIRTIVASGARSGRYTTPEEVLKYLIQHNTKGSGSSNSQSENAPSTPRGPNNQNLGASSSGMPSSSSKNRIMCHRCKKPGHVAKNCRVKIPPHNQEEKADVKPVVTCHKCGKPGHYANVCPLWK
ncbi:uncharacterized protein LOC135834040 [Planococcus citri]|uniref:uncharacterized protein LOC135834040 n=1 Tax=Planococcus citri TaxID=170843 RepID=UPI0031F9341E